LLAPALEVALDDLAVGAGAGEAVACAIGFGDAAAVGSLGAGVYVERGLEVAAEPRGVSGRASERVCGGFGGRGGSGKGGARGDDPCGRGSDVFGGRSHAIDGSCEISALDSLLAVSCVEHRT
jgi:hypothetical protein